MKTIYNTYVAMESQEQCDRMKQLCIDNGLPIWNNSTAFVFCIEQNVFMMTSKEFFICIITDKEKKEYLKITESEFIELLKTTK